MASLKFVFFGTTEYSKDLLLFLINNEFVPSTIFSIPQEFKISYSEDKVSNTNYADMKSIAEEYNIEYFEIDSAEGKDIKYFEKHLTSLNPDLLLVLGWYYMIPKVIRDLAKYGAWGIHASLLPKYAGGAPLTWAIINGETETGVTLFRMADGVDDGDLIEQNAFSITNEDTIKEAYQKATRESKLILIKVLKNIDNVVFTPQNKSKIQIYPQRNPNDGELDLSDTAINIHNFIRAQSSPYPGAFIRTIDGKKLILEKARIE